MTNPSVILGTCRERFAYWEHVDSVAQSMKFLDSKGVQVGQLYNSPTYIRLGRLEIAKQFLETDADYLCFVDSDNVLHHRTIWELLKREMPIIGALYFKRKGAPEAVAFDWGDAEMTKCHSASQRVLEWMRSHSLVVGYEPECLDVMGNTAKVFDVIGFGCTLIRRDVLETLFKEHDDIFGCHSGDVGEDVYFCRLAKLAGYRSRIDLALHIGHLKTYNVSAADFVKVGEWRAPESE